MPGFACIISDNIDLTSFYIDYESPTSIRLEQKSAKNFYIARFPTPQFPDDKVFDEDEEAVVVSEGIILNLKALRSRHGAANTFDTLKKMYSSEGKEYIKSLRGEFSGVYYDKVKEKWLIYTNHIASKPVFYFWDENLFVCASELQLVTQILRKLNRKFSLDETGAYFLLTFGYMLEDYTLIREIKKLKPGAYIEIADGKAQVQVYNTYNNDASANHSRSEVCNNLETLFLEAVTLEYEKDLEYGYKHVASLSGGLDSRMNLMTARELGYRDILAMTFSQTGAADEVIAKKIASEIGVQWLFYALDGGGYLMNTLHDAVMVNGGLVLYSGSAHDMTMLKLMDFSSLGMLHTGQIGDAVLGSFVSRPSRERPKPSAGAYSVMLLDRISSVLSKIQNEYDSEEIFKFYNRAFNGAINGNWTINLFTEASSPFLYEELLQYALTIPPDLKFKQQIYLDWILAKRPAAAKFVWQKTGCKPGAGDIAIKFKSRLRQIRVLLFGRPITYSMNPYDHWYRGNPELPEYMNGYFRQNIEVLDRYRELKSDCEKLFREGNTREKTQAMTLLEAVKIHFH